MLLGPRGSLFLSTIRHHRHSPFVCLLQQADNLEAMYKCKLACHQMFVALLAGPHQQQMMARQFLLESWKNVSKKLLLKKGWPSLAPLLSRTMLNKWTTVNEWVSLSPCFKVLKFLPSLKQCHHERMFHHKRGALESYCFFREGPIASLQCSVHVRKDLHPFGISTHSTYLLGSSTYTVINPGFPKR